MFAPFFMSNGKFCPPYCWITLLMVLLIVTWILKLTTEFANRISDAMFLGALGLVAGWLAIYTWYKKNVPDAPVLPAKKGRPSDSDFQKMMEDKLGNL